MLKDRIGGTEVEAENKEDARRMVPSPPNVVVTSTFCASVAGGSSFVVGPNVYTALLKVSWISPATVGSSRMAMLGYVCCTCLDAV